MSWEIFLGYFTGLRFIACDLPFSVLLGTAIVVHLLDGIMCRLFAYNNGYPRGLWTLLGCVFGVWAVLTLIALPKKERKTGRLSQ
ncbi:MAG: hypothetical protein FJ147_12725 [Deltaproteobacteria bacterium]|nr:hypothetical protein [Deltaproteobacteria bacterium]